MDYHNLFTIDNDTLYWRHRANSCTPAGTKAGTLRNDGYIGIFIKGKYFFAHRILWEMQVGLIPQGLFLDHINGIRDDNRISNLRICTTQENAYNRAKQSNNKSGFKGVCWHKQKQKWVAQIKIDGRNKFLGFFIDPTDAYARYCEVAIERYGDFAQL